MLKKYEKWHTLLCMSFFYCTFAIEYMSTEQKKIPLYIAWRPWIYMAVALVAVVLIRIAPVFSFQEEKGIVHVRSFTMDVKEFVEWRTDLQTGAKHVENTLSVWGLYCCYLVMLCGSIACLLCFFDDYLRFLLCALVIAAAGVYYVLIVYYAIRISDEFYATFYPSFTIICPAIVLQSMAWVRKDIIRNSKK